MPHGDQHSRDLAGILNHAELPNAGFWIDNINDLLKNYTGNGWQTSGVWNAPANKRNALRFRLMSDRESLLATGFNPFSGAWVSSPGAAELELLTTNWLLRMFGFSVVEGGGLFVVECQFVFKAQVVCDSTTRHLLNVYIQCDREAGLCHLAKTRFELV